MTGSTLATPCSLNFSLDGQFGIWHIVILLFWLVCRVVGLVGWSVLMMVGGSVELVDLVGQLVSVDVELVDLACKTNNF